VRLSVDLDQPDLVKLIFRNVFRMVFGEHGSMILEFHLRKILARDPYDVLYENPKLFCEGLQSFFGNGVKGLLKVMARELIREYGLRDLDPDTLIRLLQKGDERSKAILFNILRSSYASRRWSMWR